MFDYLDIMYDGNYVGRNGREHLFTYQGKLLAVNSVSGTVAEVVFTQMFN